MLSVQCSSESSSLQIEQFRKEQAAADCFSILLVPGAGKNLLDQRLRILLNPSEMGLAVEAFRV